MLPTLIIWDSGEGVELYEIMTEEDLSWAHNKLVGLSDVTVEEEDKILKLIYPNSYKSKIQEIKVPTLHYKQVISTGQAL